MTWTIPLLARTLGVHPSLQYEKAMQLGRPWDPYFGGPSDWLSLLDIVNFDLERKKSMNVSILQELLLIQNELRSPYRWALAVFFFCLRPVPHTRAHTATRPPLRTVQSVTHCRLSAAHDCGSMCGWEGVGEGGGGGGCLNLAVFE